MTDIYLREIQSSDVVTINRWRGDRELVDCLGCTFRHISLDTDMHWFDSYQKNRDRNVRLAIVNAADDAIVGVCYLLNIDWINRSAEYAIMIGAATSRGHGIGGMATSQVVRHAFQDLNLHRLSLSVLASNANAIALYRRAGFREEGRLRQCVFKNGAYQDVIVMALIADSDKVAERNTNEY